MALRVDSLVKRYGKLEAVKGLSFEIGAGEVFGLLGPNGAGKTTIISVIATQLRPSAGDALVFDHSVQRDVAAVRQIIGVVPQEISLYPQLSPIENIKFFGRMYGVPQPALDARIDELLGLVGLEARRDDNVETFSGGMKRRLNLAVSLVHQPRLLLLDEPTVGVDPHSREHIFTIVEGLRRSGVAILYTTHYMEEAERLCDRIGIMDEGRIIAMGPLEVLLRDAECSEVIELRGLPDSFDLACLQAIPHVARVERQGALVRLFVMRATTILMNLQQALGASAESVNVQIAPVSLENLFLRLTGKDLRD
jgi:ABC-2 type transport system ATP-binding protein